MRSGSLVITLALGIVGTVQGRGQCPELAQSPYTGEPSPFGWPVTPNDWSFAHLGHWNEKYLFCGGQRQSPIDIARASASCAVNVNGTDGNLKNQAYYKTVDMHPKVTVSPYMRTAFAQGDFGTLTLKDVADRNLEYEATQVHLTAGSLHSVDGKYYDAEMLIFHKPKGNKSMVNGGIVVSVLFSHGEESSIWSHMGFTNDNIPMETEGSWPAPHYIDLKAAMEQALEGASYQYTGSVPVPPCSENIKYIVLEQVQHVSPLQTKKLKDALICYAGGIAKRGARPNPYLKTCRLIDKNSLQGGGSYEDATCYRAAQNGTSNNSAACWDYNMTDSDKEHCMMSPIDVSASMAGQAGVGDVGVPVFNMKAVKKVEITPSNYTLDAVALDHGMPATIGNFGSIIVNGRGFLVRKISFKAVSSHTYGGVHHAGEIQIEAIMFADLFGAPSEENASAGHSSDASSDASNGVAGHRRLANSSNSSSQFDHIHLVVLSVPLKLGAESLLLRQIGLPFEAYKGAIKDSHSYTVENTVDVNAGIKAALDGPWLWYSGGLTTPGCLAWGVRWLLFETPIEVSLSQLNHLVLKISGLDSTRAHGHEMDARTYKAKVTSMTLPKSAVDDHSTCNRSKPWDYASPTCWAENFPTCAQGNRQSPINIETSAMTKTGTDNFLHKCNWRPISGLHVVNDGHCLTVANDQFGYIEIIGENGFPNFYHADQLHLRMPSEHMINGRQFAAELQIVHRRKTAVSQDANILEPLATASFFFDIGKNESNLLKQFFLSETTIPEGSYLPTKHPIDLMRSLGPAIDGDYYVYNGSFTMPDCQEMNKWFIFDHVFNMSSDQWYTFKAMFPFPGNNRPMQPLHGRKIVKNSFDQGNPAHYDFFLGRGSARNRFKPGEGMIVVPIIFSLIVMTVVMWATFVRESTRQLQSAGGLTETIGKLEKAGAQYNRM